MATWTHSAGSSSSSASAASTGSSSSDPSSDLSSRPLEFLGLPHEVQLLIFGYCPKHDLLSLALVSRRFHTLAAEHIYHTLNIAPTSSLHEASAARHTDSFQSLPALLDALTTSDYDYAAHVRRLVMDPACAKQGNYVDGNLGQRLTANDMVAHKMLNTLLVLALKVKRGEGGGQQDPRKLESLVWRMPLEISPALFKVLHGIDTLVDLQVRMHAGKSCYNKAHKLGAAQAPTAKTFPANASITSATPVYHAAPAPVPTYMGPSYPGLSSSLFPTPPPHNTWAGNTFQQDPSEWLYSHGHGPSHGSSSKPKPAKATPKAAPAPAPTTSAATTAAASGPPTFSGFKELKSLAILDIYDLDAVVPELQACIRNSARTLTKLSLSFSKALVNKADSAGRHSSSLVPIFPTTFPAATVVNTNANNGNTNPISPESLDELLGDDFWGPPAPVGGAPGGIGAGVGAAGNTVDVTGLPYGGLTSMDGAGGGGVGAGAGPGATALSSSTSASSASAHQSKSQLMKEARREQQDALAHIFGINPNAPPEGKKSKKKVVGSPDKGKDKGKSKGKDKDEHKSKSVPKGMEALKKEAQDLSDKIREAMEELHPISDDSPRIKAQLEYLQRAVDLLTKSGPPAATASLKKSFSKAKTGGSSHAATFEASPGEAAPAEAAPDAEATSESVTMLQPAPDTETTEVSEDETSLFKDSPSDSAKKTSKPARANRDVLPEDIDVEAPEGQLDLQPNGAPDDMDIDEPQAEPPLSEKKKGKQRAKAPVLAEGSKNSSKTVQPTSTAATDYARAMRGLSIETLECYMMPVKAGVLHRALDLRCLTSITLLRVEPQTSIWNLLSQLNRAQPLPLTSVHTDDVSPCFLGCMSRLDKLERVYLVKRKPASRSYLDNAKPPAITIGDIREKILAKHARTLRVLSLRTIASGQGPPAAQSQSQSQSQNTDWDFDAATIRLLARRASRLEELAASMNMAAVHMLLRCLPGFRSLRALHLVSLRNEDTCVWVMQEVRRFLVDTLTHYPQLPLEYVATESAHTIDRIVRKDKATAKSRASRGQPKTGSGHPADFSIHPPPKTYQHGAKTHGTNPFGSMYYDLEFGSLGSRVTGAAAQHHMDPPPESEAFSLMYPASSSSTPNTNAHGHGHGPAKAAKKAAKKAAAAVPTMTGSSSTAPHTDEEGSAGNDSGDSISDSDSDEDAFAFRPAELDLETAFMCKVEDVSIFRKEITSATI